MEDYKEMKGIKVIIDCKNNKKIYDIKSKFRIIKKR